MKKANYYELVYDVTRQIPEGYVSTYGNIANYLSLGSARMVGWALNQLKGLRDDVPAHRVVNRKGELSGRHFFGHPDMMAELLISEGVKIKDNCVVDFEQHLWLPSEHMDDAL